MPFDQIRDAPRGFTDILESWHRWDTTWYVIIAQSGYRYDPRSAAFFPLYPMLIRGFDPFVPGGAFPAALVVSLLGCYLTLVLVHRLTAELFDVDLARRTTFYLLI